jgi:hypothetical protein
MVELGGRVLPIINYDLGDVYGIRNTPEMEKVFSKLAQKRRKSTMI